MVIRTITVAFLLATLQFCMAHADDEIISLDGSFGSFVSLGTNGEAVTALGPDRVEPAAVEEQRVPSFWHYFSSRAIRVRTCVDDGQVGSVNASVSGATTKYVTEAGARVGDNLETVAEAYADRLQLMPETEGTIWFVDSARNNNRITFGFSEEGEMRWVALGALRENGWTCGVTEG